MHRDSWLGQDLPCRLVGMVHLRALPGSPGFAGSLDAVLEAAARDAAALLDGGCDALLVENMGDLPFLKGGVPPETVASMTLAVARVQHLAAPRAVPVGVQVLAGANLEALAIAAATGARFVRVEGFAYAHVADEGLLDACAGALLRARARLGPGIEVWADVRKKHAAHALTADLSLAEIARGTAFCGADALVVSGLRTAAPTAPEDVDEAASAGLPVVVGSGVTPADAPALARRARALIVGTWLKESGDWRRPVDPARVRRLAAALRGS